MSPAELMLARLRRDRGMAQAATTAGVTWADQAYRMVRAYLEGHEFFHVDEFWSWAIPKGLPEGESPRAIGAVIQRARRDGLMHKTRVGAPSVRSNTSDKPVWRSLTYRGARTDTFRGVPIPR